MTLSFRGPDKVALTLRVNGEPRRTLLSVLREELGLTGAKSRARQTGKSQDHTGVGSRCRGRGRMARRGSCLSVPVGIIWSDLSTEGNGLFVRVDSAVGFAATQTHGDRGRQPGATATLLVLSR